MKTMVDGETKKQIKVMTSKELQAEYQVCELTIFRWRRAGMPQIKEGYYAFYPVVRVRAWLKGHCVGLNSARYRAQRGPGWMKMG